MASFIYDASLLAYPLYQTSLYLRAPAASPPDADRWLRFWLTFGGIKLLEEMGANNIPLFYVLQGVILMSMYSAEHSVVVWTVLPKICDVYVKGVDRAYEMWTQQSRNLGIPEPSWFASIWAKATGWSGWWSSSKGTKAE